MVETGGRWRRYRTLIVTIFSLSLVMTAVAYPQRPRRVPPPQQEPAPPVRKTPEREAENKRGEAQQKAQDPEQEPSEAIKISSNLVTVPISVTDATGDPVTGLKAEDFRLEEEGQEQSPTMLGLPGETPIDLALLFDISGSVLERFEFEQQAAARFLHTVLKPSDHISVLSISLNPKIVVQRTANLDQAIAGTRTLIPTKEATAFYDTVARAAQYLGENSNPGVRRVIVVISDGEDNQSDHFRLEGAMRELLRNDCLFYSINPSGPSIRLNRISQKGQDGMIALAAETGGVAFLPERLEDLDRIFRQIASELQTQYLLGYYSTNEAADGKFRRITARIKGRPELRVRFRQGYYAPRG